MQIDPSNSRVRLVSVHVVRDHESLLASSMQRWFRGELQRSFDAEWENGSYRFGGDWLTGQAFELIHSAAFDSDGHEARLDQFEYRNIAASEPANDGLAFGFFRNRVPKYDPAIPVSIHNAGVVYSGTSVVLCWIDLALGSRSPDAWLDFLSTLNKREGSSYLAHFCDRDGRRGPLTEWILRVERELLGAEGMSLIAHSARSLQRFSRFKLIADSPQEAMHFLRATVGSSGDGGVAGTEQELSAVRQAEADIRWDWGMGGVSGVLIQQPGGIAGRGAVQLQNSFRFADRWLAYVICLLQFQIMIELEREVVLAMGGLSRMRRQHNPFRHLAEIIRMRRAYENMMDTFMDSYWKLSLIQIHSHESRHRMFKGLQQVFALEETVARFSSKLATLGSFLTEKQKSVVGWLLIYVSFVSLLLGLLSINVKGFTSEEGLKPGSLTVFLVIFTASYVVAVFATRLLFGQVSRKSRSQ